ncbi:hypothetical protein IAG44_08335 [Streptomyces roseirectus]|uniref:Uncharacterized protein n=1 Tax=Streptomyces roseirectus TaxID=2768066 RepID=A0A7H0I9I1_9ACTN|nr:hypothetical protein [Streptomyces roseirectus]QNP69447.1 hypothetical protein IAG44_08335 [Streptomyces roseirectus]
MNTSSGRTVQLGEHPVWDAALALLNRERVYVVMPDGTWHGNDLPSGCGRCGRCAIGESIPRHRKRRER